MPTLNILAQSWVHQPAFIVGDRLGLIALQAAITDALDDDRGRALVFSTDGEGYGVMVFLRNEMAHVPLGYTDEEFRHRGKYPDWMRET